MYIKNIYFSWYNKEEVDKVIQYVNLLLIKGGVNGKYISEDDIGIISPYKLQVDSEYRLNNCTGFNLL